MTAGALIRHWSRWMNLLQPSRWHCGSRKPRGLSSHKYLSSSSESRRNESSSFCFRNPHSSRSVHPRDLRNPHNHHQKTPRPHQLATTTASARGDCRAPQDVSCNFCFDSFEVRLQWLRGICSHHSHFHETFTSHSCARGVWPGLKLWWCLPWWLLHRICRAKSAWWLQRGGLRGCSGGHGNGPFGDSFFFS